ncbi:hypothetical protein Tco_1540314 [Tanacetum coccineum]
MFALLPDSGSAVPSLLHNADELYDSSTLKSFQIWGFRLVAMISRIVGALVEPTPVAVEADADSLAIEGNLDFQENSNDEADERTNEEYLSDLELDQRIKGLVAKMFDWDEEKVFNDEEMTQFKVLMALADNELIVGKNHARNGEWIDITMRKCRDDLRVFKQAKLDAVTFEIQNTELTKLNHALQEQLKEERKVNEKWLNISNKVSQCISEKIPNQKKKILGLEQLTESSSKNDVKENPFIPASVDYDHEMILKSKVGQAVNECPKLTEAPHYPKSSKESESEPLTPLPPLKNLLGASPSSKVMPLTYQDHSPMKRPGLGTMKHTKPET